VNYFPFEGDMALHLHKHKSMYDLSEVWLKLAEEFENVKILKDQQIGNQKWSLELSDQMS
jgi:hypothetical protein